MNLHRRVTADDFESFCAENPSLRAELSAQGEITIMPPAGGESSYRSLGVAGELRAWAKLTKRGSAFDSSAAGVPLAWLIDADNQTVTICRPATPPEILRGIESITATSPVEGFTLDLTEIWAGL